MQIDTPLLRATQLRAQLDHSPLNPRLRDLLDEMDHLVADEVIARIASSVAEHVPLYRKRNGLGSLSALVLEWVGAEVEPWVPSEVWAKGCAGHRWEADGTFHPGKVAFREAPGFSPEPLPILYDAVQDHPGLLEDPAFEKVREVMVLTSLGWAAQAVVHTGVLHELPMVRPFEVVARPGHDEPPVLLARL